MADSELSLVRKVNEKFTPEVMADALMKSKGLISVAARHLECDVNTVRRYIKQYASVQKAKDEAREGIKDLAEARLFQAIDRGEPWAVGMLLRTVGKDRGYVERSEHDHRINPAQVAGLSDDELDAELRKRGL
jgi:hypothetical protein